MPCFTCQQPLNAQLCRPAPCWGPPVHMASPLGLLGRWHGIILMLICKIGTCRQSVSCKKGPLHQSGCTSPDDAQALSQGGAKSETQPKPKRRGPSEGRRRAEGPRDAGGRTRRTAAGRQANARTDKRRTQNRTERRQGAKAGRRAPRGRTANTKDRPRRRTENTRRAGGERTRGGKHQGAPLVRTQRSRVRTRGAPQHRAKEAEAKPAGT